MYSRAGLVLMVLVTASILPNGVLLAQALDFNWVGPPTGGAWAWPSNWDRNEMPLGGNVFILQIEPFATVSLDSTVRDSHGNGPSIATLNCLCSLQIQNPDVEIAELSNVNGNLLISPGSVVSIHGDPQFGPNMTVAGDFLMSRSRLEGTGRVDVFGSAQVSDPKNSDLTYIQRSGPVHFFGPLDMSLVSISGGTTLHAYGSTIITNEVASGSGNESFHFHPSATVQMRDASTQFLQFINEGSVVFTGVESRFYGAFDSRPGSFVHVVSGDVRMTCQVGAERADFRNAIVIDQDAMLNMNTDATFWSDSSVVGEGTLRLGGFSGQQVGYIVQTGNIGVRHLLVQTSTTRPARFDSDFSVRELTFERGNITGNANITVENAFAFTGGYLRGSGVVTNNGELNIVTTHSFTPSLYDTRILHNNGIATLADNSTLDGSGDPALLNSEDGHFIVVNEGNIRVAVVNRGLFEKFGPDRLLINDASIDQHGVFIMHGGLTECSGGGTWGGEIEIADGATLRVEGDARTFEADALLYGPGTLNLEYGITQLHCDIDVENTIMSGGINADYIVNGELWTQNVTQISGEIRGPGILNIEGEFTCTGGGMYLGVTNAYGPANLQMTSNVTLGGNHVLNLYDTSIWTGSGHIGWNGDALVNNYGHLDLRGIGQCKQPMRNYGTLLKSQGAQSYFSKGIANEGAIEIQTASLGFGASGTLVQSRGTTTLAGGDIVSPNLPVRINGGLLVGGGTIDGDLTLGALGTIAPGILDDETDQFIVTDDLVFLAGATYLCELNGDSPGIGYDQIVCLDDVTLSGILRVSLAQDYLPNPGDVYRIITSDTITGTFAEVDLPDDLPYGMTMTVEYAQSSVVVRVTGVILTDVTVTEGSLISGGIGDLYFSDDLYVRTRSKFGFLATEANVMETLVGGITTLPAPATLDLSVESRINNSGGTARLKLRNWNTSALQVVHTYPLTTVDATETVENIDATDRVRADNGRIELAIRHAVVVTFTAAGFDSFIDSVEIGIPPE